jgi:hypothetical protein
MKRNTHRGEGGSITGLGPIAGLHALEGLASRYCPWCSDPRVPVEQQIIAPEVCTFHVDPKDDDNPGVARPGDWQQG